MNINTNDFWRIRSARHNHENREFATEAQAIEFAQTGDTLAHVVNGREESHRPVVK
jgi:hypothetical protein